MTPITVDIETFWTKDFSLSKISFMEYIMDEQFEMISLAMKIGNQPTTCAFGDEAIGRLLRSVDWTKCAMIGHNLNEFDGPALVWKYNVHPKLFVDTLALSKAKHQSEVGGSLKKLSTHYGLPEKQGDILMQTQGKRLKDFTPAELAEMERYNKQDVDNTYALFKIFKNGDVPKGGDLRKVAKSANWAKKELLMSDMTARMIIYPQFVADDELLTRALRATEMAKDATLQGVAELLGVLTVEDAKTELASATKCAEVLESMGVVMPTKISKKTGKVALAMAKTDEEFTALLEYDDPRVQAVVAARLDVKSTLLETRLTKMLKCAKIMGGWMPVPLAYHAATTGRWGGRIWNPQNLPRIDPKNPKMTDALRKSLCAPEGFKVVVSDLSGIELRVNHYLWDVESTRQLYEQDPKADLYRYFAAALYGVPEAQVTKDQRQMGKLCIAEGTLILTRKHGKTEWLPIERFTADRQLWDGKEWVWAKGVVSNGWKQTQSLCGVWLTPDHLVLSGTQWLQAKDVQGERISQALATGAENLSLRELLPSIGVGSPRLSLSAIAGFLSTRWKATTSRISSPQGATAAQRKLLVENGTGPISKLCRKTPIEVDYSTDYQRPSTAAYNQKTRDTITMAGAVLLFVTNGAQTAQSFLRTAARYLAGTSPSLRWTASTVTETTGRGTLGSLVAETTCSTNGKYQSCSSELLTSKQNLPVYDILDCGPRNRFTVLTERGPMIVHNCHLGLGFGAGWRTFKKVAKIMGNIDLDDEEAERVTLAWRMKYRSIVAGWRQCQNAVAAMAVGGEACPDPMDLCTTDKNSIWLPSGRKLHYPNLHMENDEESGKKQYYYGTGRGRSKVYAGLMDENLVQAIARDVIAEQALNVYAETGHYPAHMVHDELVYVVPEDKAQAHLNTLNRIMRTPPEWLPGIVLWSEGDIACTYGDAK